MNNKKVCKGCGEFLQFDDPNKIGYSPKENSIYCRSCFQNKNYGIVNEEEKVFAKIDKTLLEIKQKKENVLMIIDILNPYETMIKNINNYINKRNLILIVNKIDIFPKSISDKKIISWIQKIALKANLSYNKLFLISSFKKTNIDNLFDHLKKYKLNSFSVIGYSNVGKTTFLKSLFASRKKEIDNLISNSLSTTKRKIELELGDIKFNDYPGFSLSSSYQNIVPSSLLKVINPNKEIKIKNYQLNINQLINIDQYAQFITLGIDKKKEDYQFIFSNNVKIERTKFNSEKIDKKYKKVELENLYKNKKYDLIISGLGIITFKRTSRKLIIFLPKNVKYNLLESIFI